MSEKVKVLTSNTWQLSAATESNKHCSQEQIFLEGIERTKPKPAVTFLYGEKNMEGEKEGKKAGEKEGKKEGEKAGKKEKKKEKLNWRLEGIY